ncbi:hypothetical protein J0X14_14585 [Muricauda sp. CAU 1633]|uniref:hypothetical protein n=1 Tax=Allomuricauda sp. CAU 1633 TaxID=2816036 RepID=UPI001A8C33BF|nr:hypothetical protein [Muricauda sp. CAU 1633]MBO0323533.1 hypothetical protein [Muricauda sp. CAU 1633]
MERVLLSRVIIAIGLFISTGPSFGQHGYFVFNKRGVPKINADQLLNRGSLLSEIDTLHLSLNDYVLLFNKTGELFEMDMPNSYLFSAIKDHKKKFESNTMTKKYFAYVWKKFTNQIKSKQDPGVVYREDRFIKLEFPVDSAKVFSPELRFTWNNKTDQEEVFFLLKDLETGHLTKIGTKGNYILLHLDNSLLKVGQSYEWTVATSSFPNLNELKFNQLNVLNKEDFEKLQKEIEAIVKAFRLLGFSEDEIREAICQDFKYCSPSPSN